MAPISKEHTKWGHPKRCEELPNENSIVISGTSGLLPGSHNLVEFADKLYKKENFVKHGQARWNYSHPELSEYYGILPELNRFDAQFFMVHYRLATCMDAMARKLLEQVYQAIYDAGLSPTELYGTRTGVYVATGLGETEKMCTYNEINFGLLAVNRTMFANRVSYWLNTMGPSLVIDASCCSSMVALEQAVAALNSGECEYAIVAGAAIMLHPQSCIHYNRLVQLNMDGKTKCYDINADGQARSEAVNVVFMQRLKNAKRVYAVVKHVKSQFTLSADEKFALKFGPYREPSVLAEFLNTFYEEAGISPNEVEYVEGFGSALPDADKSELEAIEKVFCKNRNDQLLIGSVMSNIGYTEAASGLSSLLKVLIGYQRGEIAANIHCENPRQDIAALCDGRMRILTDNKYFNRSYVGINCLSVTGVNSHLLLQGNYKKKDLTKYHSELPYLVILSGRQESGVQKILDDLKERPIDPEEIALFQSIHKIRIKYHLSRGFGIYSTDENNKTITLSERVDYYDDAKAPLWFVYSGMGSQWSGMGAELMKIPIFADAIKRCHNVLESKGIDLIHILTSRDKNIYTNILNSFVGIAAVQIGLTDVLRAVGLVPDKIIGHSVGELGCAYADGCFTAEEMILSAYSRGLVSIETPFIRGSMAAVGIGYEKLSSMCPPEIEIACHNGPESSTISGPADAMKQFVAELTAKGIFAKEVPCSNIAYHSRYISEAGPGLLKYLSKVIHTPKLRSERWMSTSIPQEKWNESAAKYSSAEYHTNNLLNPVLFEETSRLVPSNAVLVEIAPHGLLQAILKRSLPLTCQHIPLTRRGHSDNALLLLEAIGKIYMAGYDVNISALYPKIEFPVSTETRSLSHLIEWAHGEAWPICLFEAANRSNASVYKPIITLHDDEYLRGHVIEGRRVFPFASSLVAVWDTLAMSVSKPIRELSVQFRDINLYVQPPLYEDKPLNINVMLLKGNGRFEVTYEHGMVADGYILAVTPDIPHFTAENNDPMILNSIDFYKLLHERGYQYSGDFRTIESANFSLTRAKIAWKDNWVTFIDGLLQFCVMRNKHDAVSLPKYIKKISIDMKKHWKETTGAVKGDSMDAEVDEYLNVIKCSGLMIEHINFVDKPPISRQKNDLKVLKFYRYFQDDNTDISTALYVYVQIVAENLNKNEIVIIDLASSSKPSLIDEVKYLLDSLSDIKIEIIKLNPDDLVSGKAVISKADLVIVNDSNEDKAFFESVHSKIPSNIFLISFGDLQRFAGFAPHRTICSIGKGQAKLVLGRWKPRPIPPTIGAVSVRSQIDLEQLKTARHHLQPQSRLLVLINYPPTPGVMKLVKQWRKEKERNDVYMAMIKNKAGREQDLEDLPNLELAFNVLDHGKWGGEFYIPLREENANDCNVTLQSKQLGDINSLHWVEAPPLTGTGIPVTVSFAGLSVYDAKRARVEIPLPESSIQGYGMDFSGVTERGDRVMGLVSNGSASSKVMALPELLWPVPEHWSLEDAATVPMAYVHAFYCLGIKTSIRRGMNILVHGGTGALGQAAISIALGVGCNVFTTVSEVSKKRFLRQLFPNLPAEHIGNSRDGTFGDMVLNATRGEGCHIIISCVKGELKNITLHCLSHSGTVLDIDQIHSRENFNYGMSHMFRCTSYQSVDFPSMFKYQNYNEMKKIQLMLSEGIRQGYVRPLTRVVFGRVEASRAFRFLAGSRHRGRALLNIKETLTSTQTHSRLVCSPELSHLLLCDKGDFGVQLADRLVTRGARKLYIHCQQATSYLKYKIQSWQKLGVKVDLSSSHLNNRESVLALLKHSNRSAPIEGIYVVATEVDDAYKSRLSSMLESLDVESRKLRPTLRYFAVITENDKSFGEEISLDRIQNKLPSVTITLRNLEKFVNENRSDHELNADDSLKCRNALDLIEAALRSKEAVAFASSRPQTQYDLLEEVAKIPGVTINNSTADGTFLEHIGIDSGRAQELCNVLENKFNITIAKDSLPQMTVAKLKTLQVKSVNLLVELRGFDAYFNYIDPDELLATTEIVLMPTLVQSSEMRSDEFDMNQTYLCIVPGMEGHHGRFRTLCERLRLPAAVLQLGLDSINETVTDTARRLVDVMIRKMNMKERFHLLGCEFGVPVVLEMAAILEDHGLKGTVYLLGGTPDDIRSSIDRNLPHSDAELQNSLAQFMHNLMTGSTSVELEKKLSEVSTWEEKVVESLKTLRGHVPYSSYYTQALIKTAYARIQSLRHYETEMSALRSNVILLRATLPTSLDIETLQRYSQLPVAAYELKASLPYIAKDLRCSTLINNHLEADVLEAFNNRNHCETYLLNDEQYLVLRSE